MRTREGTWGSKADSSRQLLSVPAILGLIVFFVAPLVTFALYSFLTAGLYSVSPPGTLENYRGALGSSLVHTLATNSLVIGISAAVVSVTVSIPVAYWLRYRAGRLRMPVLFLILGTIFASYLVRIYAWRTILGENGILHTALQRLGLTEEPLSFLLYSRFAVTVALVQIYVPYVVLVLYAAFAPVTPSLIESAQDLGATTSQRWRKLLLPLVAAPTMTSFLLVFILSASDYVTPQLLGGTGGLTLGVHIQTSMTGLGDWAVGSAVAMLMLAAFSICYGLTSLGLRLARLDRIHWST